MRSFILGTVATALLLGTPVLAQTPAGDSEIQSQLGWEQTVARAEAYRTGVRVGQVHQAVDQTNTGASSDRGASQVGTSRPATVVPTIEPFQDR